MAARRALTALGVVVAVLGLLAFVEPAVASLAFTDRFYVSAVGFLALVQAGRVLRGTRSSPTVRAETGDPEIVTGVPTPGDDFDEALVATADVHSIAGRDEVEERLARIGRAVLERRRDCSPEMADELLANGTWTDDPLAAAFFSDDAADRIPLTTRLRLRWSGRSSFSARAERATAELERVRRDDS